VETPVGSLPVAPKPYDADFVPTEEGIFELSWGEYLKIKALNSSTLPYLRKSPAHALDAILNASTDSTPAMDMGHGFHCLVLEPDRFNARVIADWEIDYTGKAVSKNRNDYKAWRNSLDPNVVVLSRKSIDQIKLMARNLKGKQCVRDRLQSGYPERTVLFRDPRHGFWCKARIDWISTDYSITDMKKTRSADRWSFYNSVERYSYNWQAWFYKRAVRAVTGIEHDPYYWIAWEDTGPCDGRVYTADPAKVSAAGDQILVLLDQWAECLATGEFPGYPDEVVHFGDTYSAGIGFAEDLDEAIDGIPF